MTAAMIRAAARLVEELELKDTDIVSFTEIGSEGALLTLNAFVKPGPYRDQWLIARNGESRKRPT